MLSPEDFDAFFTEVHGCSPFPWQKKLLFQIAGQSKWPSVLDLPTGSGKTAAIDIAIFHLALEANRGEVRCAPVRIAFVVDRRLVVDDAFARAKNLEKTLGTPRGPVTARVAECLKKLSGDGPPLIARRLRGGIPREDDWARTPSQPTVLCSTVDQVGSRLLFRGYGVSDSMKPVHAGLIGSDCLMLLDEAHLAEPFRQTLEWVRVYRGQNWREMKNVSPWGVTLLTATPGKKSKDIFSLGNEDKQHPVLKKRIEASKPVYLIAPEKPTKTIMDGTTETSEEEDELAGNNHTDLIRRATTITKQVQEAIKHFRESWNVDFRPAIGVVVNRVARARFVFEQLRKEFQGLIEAGIMSDPILMIGPARPVDRDELVTGLNPIRTRTWQEGETRTLNKILILVATQCIEAGVDIDLDALITEVAPLDCLRQRFGRLNRAGRDFVPYAAIVTEKSDISTRSNDPVYGKAIKFSWECLNRKDVVRKEGRNLVVDFGLSKFTVPVEPDALAPKGNAPILLPAHLDLLSQTSPIPAADPDVALYLHGTAHHPDSITVVWRSDINPEIDRDEDVRRLLMIVPPRALEAIELPLWAVRRWLMQKNRTLAHLADIATSAPAEDEYAYAGSKRRKVFRWRGNEERSCWIDPVALRAGDTIIVPAGYGGVDQFGWNPECEEPATDVARQAAEPFAGRRFAVRIAPGLLGRSANYEVLADVLASAVSQRWQDLRTVLMDLDLPKNLQDDLIALDCANKKRSVTAYVDLYGTLDGRPRGVVFIAPFGIKHRKIDEEGGPNTTEDDTSGSVSGFSLSLQQHSFDVELKAEAFARAAGLSVERIMDLKLAGFLHDAGKADPRFQAWLHYGDPLGHDLDDEKAILAKSNRPLPLSARAKSGLPEYWRHEALSVRLARKHGRLREAYDPDLVLWLVGTHHGYGHPFFPHQDPTEKASDVGPQSLAFDWNGLDWSSLFARLKARYGIWELARMEAILRLADHRASEERAKENAV